MFCKRCGQQLSADSAFCNRCGSALSTPQTTASGRSATSPQTTGRVGFIARFRRAGPPAWIGFGVCLFLIVGLVTVNYSNQQQSGVPSSSEHVQNKTESVGVNRPATPPPKYRVYRSKLDEGTSVVVSPATTDDQLRSLLWLFREKV